MPAISLCTQKHSSIYASTTPLENAAKTPQQPLCTEGGADPHPCTVPGIGLSPQGPAGSIPSSLERGPSPALLSSAPDLWEEQLQSLEMHPGERLKEQPSRCSTRLPWQEGKASLAAPTHSKRRAQLQHREIPVVHPAQGCSSGHSQLHQDSSKWGQGAERAQVTAVCMLPCQAPKGRMKLNAAAMHHAPTNA